jgi:alkylhydroperoxidase/carboxymuconolactone decarboxylase family protein YurZ
MNKELPEFLQKVIKKYPKVWDGHQTINSAVGELEGLDGKTQHLVKLAVAIGAGLEGAVHSHVRRSKEAGLTDEEIYHTALLAITTIGWPSAIAALSWIDDILKGIKAQK